jgi:hypothetical protein
MVSLSFLPPETLNSIMELLTCFQIGRLLVSGCLMLSQKLMNGGGVKKLKFRNWSYEWPSIIGQLPRLEHLKFQIYKYNPPTPELILKDLLKLRNLKSLTFLMNGIDNYLRSLLEKDPTILSSLQTLNLSGLSQQYQFIEQLPNLTSLRLRSITSNPPSLSIRSLPPNLTNLEATLSKLVIEGDDDRFPSSMTSVNVSLLEVCNIFALLPENLICLDMNIRNTLANRRLVKVGEWTTLPRTLTRLSIPCSSFGVAKAKMLPLCIQELRIVGKHDITEEECINVLELLPKTMREIHGIFPRIITARLASMLPRTLSQHIYIDVDWDAVHLLPSQMRTIYLFESGLPPVIQGLPSGLDVFHVEFGSPSVYSCLPPNLRTFELQNGPMTLEQVKSLPPSLLTLEIVDAAPSLHFDTFECWKHLPRSLNTLNIAPSSFDEERGAAAFDLPTWDCSSWLPPSLTCLNIGILNTPSSEWFSHLPATLEMINLSVVELPDMAMENMNRHLPALIDLEICWTSSQPHGGIGRYISKLPRGLLQCVLALVGNKPSNTDPDIEVNDEHLKNLPPLLERLTLPPSPQITEACTAFFPRSMIGFRLKDSTPTWFTEWKQSTFTIRRKN